jgi:hypothetical protein
MCEKYPILTRLPTEQPSFVPPGLAQCGAEMKKKFILCGGVWNYIHGRKKKRKAAGK